MFEEEYFPDAFQIEFARLGLNRRDLPWPAVDGGHDGEARFLQRLRQSSPGVTWHEVLPRLPAHWVPGKPDTWTPPYRPLGTFDYQELPTSPAWIIAWDRPRDRSCLANLVADARAVGFAILGADFCEERIPDPLLLPAIVVFERGTTANQTGAFWAWLDERGEARLLLVLRNGAEGYAP
jgi:hypothetical protein